MISIETRMICKSIDELTKEIRKLRKAEEDRMNYEDEIFMARRKNEEKDTPLSMEEGI